MEHLSILFSLIFFTAFTVYLFFSIYILHLNMKSAVNRTFFAVCLALCLWSFGFSMANSASSAEACLFWRRFCALGWAPLHSLIVHFILTLTGHKKVLKKWWFYPILYFPAAINVSIFSLSNNFALVQYHMVQTPSGWVNIAVNNGWDFFFYTYYAFYAAASLWLIAGWKRKNRTNKNVIIQANLILTALFTAYVLGSITDVVYNTFASTPIPQLAPVITLIPISAFYYSIKRFGMMTQENVNVDEIILTDDTRKQLYRYLSIAYITFGLLNGVSQFNMGSISSCLYSSAILFAFAAAIHIINRSRSESLKYSLNMATIILSIPTISFLFGSNTALWVFPFVLIIITLVFNTRSFFIAIAITTVSSQFILLLYSCQIPTAGSPSIFATRIGIDLVVLWLGYYVNKIYISKLKEISFQIGCQRIIAEISFDFVGISQQSMDDKINKALNRIGALFHADDAYLHIFKSSVCSFSKEYNWYKQSNRPIPTESAARWTEQINQNNSVYISDTANLPETAENLKNLLAQCHIKSFASMPIEINRKMVGSLGINYTECTHKWNDDQLEMLKIIANLFTTGFIKIGDDKEIEHMAFYDHLTSLPNRTLFANRTVQAIAMAKRNEKLMAIMFIDLDGFKTVNDTLGHKIGDVLLIELADGLTSHLRESDTVARFGGDEFLIMINNISTAEEINKVVENIMSIFNSPFDLNGKDYYVTASAGIAVFPVDGDDVDTLVKNADIAMYRAKSLGKNQYVFCSLNLKDEMQKNMKLSNDLFWAQERDELVLFYQPQINLSNNQITGMEALLRWRHPQMGMISPDVFIHIAEKNGLINSIGDWVLRKACEQNKKWQNLGYQKFRMSVNISIHQFNNPRLVENVGNTLKETGLEPQYVELEITESTAIRGPDYIADILRRLKNLGVYISIDDFGTGYSSLNRLKILPIDRVKIDMQFIQGMDTDEKDKEITKIIIYLAKSLGIHTLAEGVETASQLDFLNQKMCDEVQGYYYYKPMSVEEVEKILRANL